MPSNIIMADATTADEIKGAHFTVKRIVAHIPADNGVTNTQGVISYLYQLLGKASISRSNQIPYFRYVDDPTPVKWLVRSIGPSGNVYRCIDAETGMYGFTSVGSSYDAALVEGDVEICYLEGTQL